jgi:hypothetical protein
MRFVVSFFGIVASAMTMAAGIILICLNEALSWALGDPEVAKLLQMLNIDEGSSVSMTNVSHANAGLVVVVAALYGFLGSFLVLFRSGKQGGMLLLLTALGAALVNPLTLIFTWFAILVSFMCFFIGPLPINPPADKDADEEEEEEPKPRAKGKAKKEEPAEEEEEEMPRPKGKAKPKKADDDDDE